MPQVAGHLTIADEVKKKLGNPDFITGHREAYNLGAIGPDMFLFLFDSDRFAEFIGFMNDITSIYSTIHDVKQVLDDVTDVLAGPAVDLAEWIIGPFGMQILDVIGKAGQSLKMAFTLSLVPESGPVTVENPFADVDLPGFSSSQYMTVEASDLSRVLRYFGAPYSVDQGYKDHALHGTYRDWWWVDIAHYRRTGPFAQELLQKAANDPLLKAYSTGYYTHVAGDICGHPFTNATVGGPYRTHVLRHMVLENIADTWIWNHFRSEELSRARLDRSIELGGNDLDKIVTHILKALEDVYPSSVFNDKAYPTEQELISAYERLYIYLYNSTSFDVNAPTPPPGSWNEFWEEIGESLGDTAENIPGSFSGDNEWWEWLLAPFLAAGYALVLLFKIATLPAVVIRNAAELPLRWLLFYAQQALYEFIMNAKWQLTLGGWGKAMISDLSRPFARTAYMVPWYRSGTGTFDYPNAQVPHDIHGFWLKDPQEFSNLASPKAECCPFAKQDTPAIFIDGPGYDSGRDAMLKKLADKPLNVDATVALEQQTYLGPQFGNAVDFTLKLLDGTYPSASFDLDADIGYGMLSWLKQDYNVNNIDPLFRDEIL